MSIESSSGPFAPDGRDRRSPDTRLSPRTTATNPWSPDDGRFVAALESCTLPRDEFGHRAHLRLAWLYLRAEPYESAVWRIERTIRRYASHFGVAEKYHRTITVTWMRLVAAAAAATPDIDRFDAFLRAHEDLMDSGTLRRYYSADRLATPSARTTLVEPDRRPLSDMAGTDGTNPEVASARRADAPAHR